MFHQEAGNRAAGLLLFETEAPHPPLGWGFCIHARVVSKFFDVLLKGPGWHLSIAGRSGLDGQ